MENQQLDRVQPQAVQNQRREAMRDEALEAAGVGVWEFMPGEERLYFDKLALAHFGVTGEAGLYLYSDLIARVHPEDREMVEKALTNSMEDENVMYDVYYRTKQSEGGWKWLRAVGKLGSGRMAIGDLSLSGTTRDVSVEKEYEAQLIAAHEKITLMEGELNHRVKNLFAIMGFLITQSGRGAASADEAMAKARERIDALSRAHALGTGSCEPESFDLEVLIKTILSPYPLVDTQLTYSGPAIELPSEKLTSLGIVFHELSTNAVKYGALQKPGRALEITWKKEAGNVKLVWMETGSIDLADNLGNGFGTKAIDLTAKQLGGTSTREFFSNGMIFHLSFPV